MSTPARTPAIERIGQISIVVDDLEAAIAFYRDKLGLALLFRAPPSLAFFDCGGVRLMVDGAAEGDGAHGTSILYYKVPDIRAAHEALVQQGVEFVQPPHEVARMADHALWLAFLRDPAGNVLALMGEVR